MISLLKRWHGKHVGLDTMVFIYALEEHFTYLPLIRTFFREVEAGKIFAVTSTITLAECLVQPFRSKALDLAARYKILFRDFPHLSVVPVSSEIAEKAARFRAQYQIRTPDAIQIATAFVSGCPVFLTNDEALPPLKEIQICLLKEIGDVP